MTVKIAAFRTFVTVADMGALAEAADRLGRTPSAVSMTLKQLEVDLGGPLFEGDRKRSLTPLGRFTRDSARQVVEHFDAAVHSARAYARAEIGGIRIAATPSVAGTILPDLLTRFLDNRPKLSIDLRDLDSRTILSEIMAGRVDVGLASIDRDYPDIAATPLFSDRFGLVCRADHPLAFESKPIDWRDLKSARLIANGLSPLIRHPVAIRLSEQAGLTIRNTTSILALVAAGAGVSLLPRLAFEGADSSLRFLELTDRSAVRRIFLLSPRRSAPNPANRAFLEELPTLAKPAIDAIPYVSALHSKETQCRSEFFA